MTQHIETGLSWTHSGEISPHGTRSTRSTCSQNAAGLQRAAGGGGGGGLQTRDPLKKMQQQSFIFHKHILCITPHPTPLNSQLSERTSKPECTRASMRANTRAAAPQKRRLYLNVIAQGARNTHPYARTHARAVSITSLRQAP